MTEHDKNEIIKHLMTLHDEASALGSIEEKRKLYIDYSKVILPFLTLDNPIDVESEEFNQLITEQFLSIDFDAPNIFQAEGYTPWLADKKNGVVWKFYNRYEQYLSKKSWKPEDIISLANCSDIILDHMGNPYDGKRFGKQGLVIGDIQSGKTANYTAVINKALDVGYKIIIVLAGVTTDLRDQTQVRLDSEVLGYQTKSSGKGNPMGVGEIYPMNIEGLTFADEAKANGDMKKYFSSHTLDDQMNPVVAIVKKNKSILEHLIKFLATSQDYCYWTDEGGSNKRLKVPTLIIDDEVDQASVNTKKGEELKNASTINKLIRTILSGLGRYSYVGYTATPFANIFIDPDANDIYPNDFILTIPSSKDYCGIEAYFGVDPVDENSADHTIDLFVNLSDYGDLFATPAKMGAKTETIGLNKSLKEAIKSFILSAAIKKARGFDGHNSMLIHISQFKNPATTLMPFVKEYVKQIQAALRFSSDKENEMFRVFWINHFRDISEKRLGDKYADDWEKIKTYLLPTVESAANNIKVLNGDTADAIDYSATKQGDFIVIGGNKLSRGLTLEGLTISYYYRNSKSYDSLLQMGRWFGYRKGWMDVCRVYTTTRFMNNFINVGKVLMRFKEDINDMARQNLNPRDVGQRIMHSPNLIPTARNKMRNAKMARVSLSGQLQQIISFDRDAIEKNRNETIKFVKSLGKGEVHKNCKVVFKNIPVEAVLEYLKKYKEYGAYNGYGQISVKNWIKYIEKLSSKGELSNWTIVLSSLSAKKEENKQQVGDYTIYRPSRTLREVGDSSEKKALFVKTNTDPKDFAEFYPEGSSDYLNTECYSPANPNPGFDSKHALMALYFTDLYEKENDHYDPVKNKEITKRGKLVEGATAVAAPAIWFPKTSDYEASAVDYYVNKDYEKNMNGENDDDVPEEDTVDDLAAINMLGDAKND